MSALTDRDANAQPTSNPTSTGKPTVTGEENRSQERKNKHLLEQKSDGQYVSPSDAIMSPASHKLAGFKQRQINKPQNGKKTTSRLLFAKTPSSCSGGTDDLEGADERTSGQ